MYDFKTLKFKKVSSELYPLKTIESFSSCRAKEDDWIVQRVTVSPFYYEWFALPVNFDYQEYPRIQSYPNQKKARARPAFLYELRSQNKRQPIEQILIGLHPNQQMSILVFFRHGVAQKCVEGLRGAEGAEFQFLYAPRVGFDIRQRAAQYIGCSDRNSINQVQAFMYALHSISPLNDDAIALWETIVAQAYHQLTIMQEWQPHESYGVTSPLTIHLSSSYPNNVPDTFSDDFITYYPDDILNFPTEIPDVHQAILDKDRERLNQLLLDSPMLLYRRDPWGDTPIDLACLMGEYQYAYDIYQFWSTLDESKQWLAKLFFTIVNSLVNIQSADTPKLKYYERLLPGIPNAKLFYDCLKLNDEAAYQSLWQALILQDNTYQSLFEQYSTLKSMQVLCDKNFPKRSKIHSDIIAGQTYLIKQSKEDQELFDKLSKLLKRCALSNISTPQAETFNETEPRRYLEQCQPIFNMYRHKFLHVSDPEYAFYIKVLALSLYREVQAQLNVSPITTHNVHYHFVAGWLKDLKQEWHEFKDGEFKCFHILNAKYYLDVCRRSLLLSEQQDPWGYTPVLLAIISSNTTIVKNCISFQRGDILIRDNARLCYDVLDHAQGTMIELLCSHGVDPNKQNLTIFSRQSRNEYWLLMFYRFISKRDYRLLMPIEQRLISRPADMNKTLALLDVLLKYHDDYVVDGPYDDHIPDEIVNRLEKHNREIERKKTFLLKRPRYNNHGIESIPNLGKTFVTTLSHLEKTYCSVICRFSQMSLEDKHQISEIFCQNFYIKDDPDSSKCKEYCERKILSDPDYLIETHYDESSGKVAGFACVKLIKCPDKPFNLLYFSIVAMHYNYKHLGLVFSSMKLMQASVLWSDKPCKMYCRLGRPGFAYTFIPKSAVISTKYSEPNLYLEAVAQIVNNRIEADGMSLPPFYVRGQRDSSDHYHSSQDEYEYMIDNVLQSRHPEASLPIVFTIDQPVVRELQDNLQASFGFSPNLCKDLSEYLVAIQETSMHSYHSADERSLGCAR